LKGRIRGDEHIARGLGCGPSGVGTGWASGHAAIERADEPMPLVALLTSVESIARLRAEGAGVQVLEATVLSMIWFQSMTTSACAKLGATSKPHATSASMATRTESHGFKLATGNKIFGAISACISSSLVAAS